jgi:hypothetical protein
VSDALRPQGHSCVKQSIRVAKVCIACGGPRITYGGQHNQGVRRRRHSPIRWSFPWQLLQYNIPGICTCAYLPLPGLCERRKAAPKGAPGGPLAHEAPPGLRRTLLRLRWGASERLGGGSLPPGASSGATFEKPQLSRRPLTKLEKRLYTPSMTYPAQHSTSFYFYYYFWRPPTWRWTPRAG